MASTANKAPDSPPSGPSQSLHPPRPHGPSRTLSSSLRLYSSPLVPRAEKRAQTFPSNSNLSPQLEAAETDSLLRWTSDQTGAQHYGESDEGDDDQDIEAIKDDEQADSDGLYPPHCCYTADGRRPPKRSDLFGNFDCDVYGNIHRVRQEIITNIDDPYSLEQLKTPRMNASVIRPLVEKFYNMQDLSIIFCLLVNRAQFIREQSYAAHHQTVNLTRALLCELLAEKVLRRYNEFNPGPRGLLKLSNILVAGFDPFQGAPESVIKESTQATDSALRKAAGYHHHKMTALEVAIVGESKSFLANTTCQKVVDAIYRGKVVFSPSTYMDIIPDRWKRRPISLYDPRRAPILNQYRLVVPRTRAWLEVIQFIILLLLYIGVMIGRETRETVMYGPLEAIFDFFTLGWILDQVASMLEHGWHVYTQNLWSFLDVTFSVLFMIYFGLRMRGLHTNNSDDAILFGKAALDVLSCAAPVLIPRLAFNVMSENMLFLSLRAMMGDFITLTALAVWCFAGFLLSLKWLHNGIHDAHTISKWMIFVWFGLDGTGIDKSPEFHPILGPALFVIFAFLGNTLFLTILVSMLSNTFSTISGNAVQEIQYRRAVLTLLGVKSDSLFAFFPPLNLVALVILAPLKWILTPHFFHTVNVFMVRVANLPQLILISWYERNTLWVSSRYRQMRSKRVDWNHHSGPRVISSTWWSQTFAYWDMSSFSTHADVYAVFESDPPDEVLQKLDSHESNDDAVTKTGNGNGNKNPSPNKSKDSSANMSPISPTLSRFTKSPKKKGLHTQFISPIPTPTRSPRPISTNNNSASDSDGNNENNTNSSAAQSGYLSPKSRSQSQSLYSSRLTSSTNTNTNTNTTATSKRSSTTKKPRSRPRLQHHQQPSSSHSQSDAALRAEFHDSDDEAVAKERRKSRSYNKHRATSGYDGVGGGAGAGGHRTVNRKDSLIDYNSTGDNLPAEEANARLVDMEARLERMEALLVQAVRGIGSGDGNSVGAEDEGSGTEADALETLRVDVGRDSRGFL